MVDCYHPPTRPRLPNWKNLDPPLWNHAISHRRRQTKFLIHTLSSSLTRTSLLHTRRCSGDKRYTVRRLTPPPTPPPPKKGKKGKKKMEKKNECSIESGHLYFKAELLLVDILSFNLTPPAFYPLSLEENFYSKLHKKCRDFGTTTRYWKLFLEPIFRLRQLHNFSSKMPIYEEYWLLDNFGMGYDFNLTLNLKPNMRMPLRYAPSQTRPD